MKCAKCKTTEASATVSITPNFHYRLCAACDASWLRAAQALRGRMGNAAVVAIAFRRWQEGRAC